MKIVGHKGAAGYAPENTILSFQKAIELGCDRAELDVHISKDKEVIVIHDEIVDRISDGKGKVSDMTLAEIKKLNCSEGQKISTLQEVIDFCKGKIDLQIELKGKNTSQSVGELIIKNNILDSALVTSFEVDFLREIKKINHNIKTGLLLRKINEGLWSLTKELSLEYICPKSTIVTKELVEEVHKLNLKVYAYHVNDKETWYKMDKLGVDDIGTDFPDLVTKQ